jgi:L-serine dehydratase
MFLSVFDMFKVGIGPSSSHTMGPMVAAARFLDSLRASPFHFHGLRASLHGSLAFTGVGHATDRATILGLAGFEPATYDADKAEAVLARIKETKVIEVPGLGTMAFDPAKDLLFDYGPALSGHANGMILKATDAQGDVIREETYYSIGGGFVLTASELAEAGGAKSKARADVPWPVRDRRRNAEMAKKSGLSIAAMKRANELKFRTAAELDAGINRIWQVMNDCISRGMKGEGILPGGLKVRRRAKGIHDALKAERGLNLTAPHTINDWMSCMPWR